jgi:hypothetical protein
MSDTPISDTLSAISRGRDIERRDYYAALDLCRELERKLSTIRASVIEDAWPDEPPREWLVAMADNPLILAASDEEFYRKVYADLQLVAIRALGQKG